MCTSGGILSGAAGNLDRLVVLEKILVEGHVLGFVSEDGVVSLEAVFLEERFVSASF